MPRNLSKLLVVVLAMFCTAPAVVQARRNPDRVATEAISLYAPEQRRSTFDGCKAVFPGGKPLALDVVPARWKPRGLCSNTFAVLHSGLSKTPLVVVERLSRQMLLDARDEERTDEFYPDPRLPRSERADLSDFKGSGFDRGHMSPAADQPDVTAMAQSFALSNMIPQDRINNQRIWARLEMDTRKYAMRAKGDVFVFSGPLFRKTPQATIGDNRVWVPSHLFKLVHDAQTGRTWAHVLSNDATRYEGPPLSYAEFVQQTGWRLLPGAQ